MESDNVMNGLKKIKSDYILKKIFSHMNKPRTMKIINHNKNFQRRLQLTFEDYKEYSETFSPIVIEITVAKDKSGSFINIYNSAYFHIYFNDEKEEIKRNYIKELENVKKIKIIIDYQITSFENLFNNCKCIESINFKSFHRNNITTMKYMFNNCTSLIELNFSSFNTDNVTNMIGMFYNCKLLNELNLSKFN